jgi:hypothetical protein
MREFDVTSKFRILAVGVASALAASVAGVAGVPAQAAIPDYAVGGTAGGTQITAVGTTISSSATAQSAYFGFKAGQSTNKVASVKAGTLAAVGAVTTDVTAVNRDNGFTLTSHSRTAGVSLLGGLIKVQAVDTTSTAASSDGAPTTAGTTTQLVGLTIAGKTYPINMPANSGVNIPGVASITINAQATGIHEKTAVTTGAGLIVTLLAAKNGAAAGAVIMLNPTFAVVQPAHPDNPDAPSLGGGAYSAFVQAHATEAIKAETGRLANVSMPLAGTGGATLNNHVARARVAGVINVGVMDSYATGITTADYAKAETVTKTGAISLFGGLIKVGALGTTSKAEMVDDTFTTTGAMQFINLKVAGTVIPIDVAPNTTINVANLGTVTINEQKSVGIAGVIHGFQVIGVHIKLDVAKAGLPVGAEVQLATSQAIIWR